MRSPTSKCHQSAPVWKKTTHHKKPINTSMAAERVMSILFSFSSIRYYVCPCGVVKPV